MNRITSPQRRIKRAVHPATSLPDESRVDGTTDAPYRRVRRDRARYSQRYQFLAFAAILIALWLLHGLVARFKADQDSQIASQGRGVFSSLWTHRKEGQKNISAFAGRTRARSGDTPRIAIVTNAVPFPYDEKTTGLWSMFKEYFANKDCYARMHGYDLIVDSRNHVNGMGFFIDADTGERGPTNVHFNKPYLIRKWLPHYDWVLWLDMDTLVVDMERPVEDFIEEVGGQGGDIHVLVPQDQNVQFFFSACSLLLRNSPETMAMVQDWFTLKDTCPYALYDDQSRLYAAILRMQLKWKGLEVDHSKPGRTDCLDFCVQKETQKKFSWCVDRAIRESGIRRVPHLIPPVAYSRLPTNEFSEGTDTGLVFQGQFGGIKYHPQLVKQAFSVHTKPYCQRNGIQVCSPFVDGILAPNYQKGMQRCFGAGWFSTPYAALEGLNSRAPSGPTADDEVLALNAPVRNESSIEGLVPGLNVPYGIPFKGLREQHRGHKASGPGWRKMGSKDDKQFCFASLPGAGGKDFMGEALAPLLIHRFCSHGDCNGISKLKARRRAEKNWLPCRIKHVWQVFPYTLMTDYAYMSKQPLWLLSMIRHPVDRVLASYSALTIRLREEAPGDENFGWGGQGGWSKTLNRLCSDTSFVQYAGNPPPTFGPEMTVGEYVEIPGVDDIMTKFYMNKEWDGDQHGGLCMGRARPLRYRPGGWEQFHHWQANAGVGALMEYQFFGVWELWKQSLELLKITFRAEDTDSADIDPPPADPKDLLGAGSSREVEAESERLKHDPVTREVIANGNKKDMMLYERAVMEFKRRCRYFGIKVPNDPYRLDASITVKN